jgi:hypothetical protein
MWRVSAFLFALTSFGALAQQSLSDPTAPPSYRALASEATPGTELRLQAIRQNSDGLVATLNGREYRKGDTITPYKIEEITMNYVTVIHTENGSELQLAVFNQSSFMHNVEKRAGGHNE